MVPPNLAITKLGSEKALVPLQERLRTPTVLDAVFFAIDAEVLMGTQKMDLKGCLPSL